MNPMDWYEAVMGSPKYQLPIPGAKRVRSRLGAHTRRRRVNYHQPSKIAKVKRRRRLREAGMTVFPYSG